jgi:hypothetical protein
MAKALYLVTPSAGDRPVVDGVTAKIVIAESASLAKTASAAGEQVTAPWENGTAKLLEPANGSDNDIVITMGDATLVTDISA